MADTLLGFKAPPVKLTLRPGLRGMVELVASGGPGDDEQVLLRVYPDGYIVRVPLLQGTVPGLGLEVNDKRLVFDLNADGSPELLRDHEVGWPEDGS